MPATHAHTLPWTRPASGPLAMLRSMVAGRAAAAAADQRRAPTRHRGHAMLLQFEPRRLSMRCHNCGEETPGWAIGD